MKIDLGAEERTIRKALKSAVAKARDAGVANPVFFVECEGPTIYVMDGDRDEVRNSHRYHAGERQRAIVGEIGVEAHQIGVSLDVGAW